jgi:hypothetical protein
MAIATAVKFAAVKVGTDQDPVGALHLDGPLSATSSMARIGRKGWSASTPRFPAAIMSSI